MAQPFHRHLAFFLPLATFVALLACRLDAPPNNKRAEIRPIICAREMLASGNYLVPTEGGVVRLAKPPLSYWLDCLSAQLSGGAPRNWSTRLPALLAAIGILLLLWRWTLLLPGDRDGRTAALAVFVVGGNPLFFNLARSSEAEMLLSLCVLGAGFHFWKASRGSVARADLALAYAWVTAGLLVKGPVALILPLLPYLVVRGSALRREWRWHAGGLLLALLPLGLWAVACYATDPQAVRFFRHELFGQYFNGADHGQPFYYYLILLLTHFAVFVPFLIPAARAAWRQAGERRFLLWFVLLNVAWLSVLGGKQDHYILPLFAPLALLLAAWLMEQRENRWLQMYFLIVSVPAAMAAIVVLLFFLPAAAPLVLLPTGIVLGVLIFLHRHRLPIPGLWAGALAWGMLMQTTVWFTDAAGRNLVPESLMAAWLKNRDIRPLELKPASKSVLALYYWGGVLPAVTRDEAVAEPPGQYFLVNNGNDINWFRGQPAFAAVREIGDPAHEKRGDALVVFERVPADSGVGHHASRLLLVPARAGNSALLPTYPLPRPYRLDAILPEVNPFPGFAITAWANRWRWERGYRRYLTEGVEVWAQFDPRESRFRRAWFHDAPLWGAFQAPMEKKTFNGGQCELWIVARGVLERDLSALEAELQSSQALYKLLFLQSASPGEAAGALPPGLLGRLKSLDVTLLNTLLPTRDCPAAELTLTADGRALITMYDNNGGVKSTTALPASPAADPPGAGDRP